MTPTMTPTFNLTLTFVDHNGDVAKIRDFSDIKYGSIKAAKDTAKQYVMSKWFTYTVCVLNYRELINGRIEKKSKFIDMTLTKIKIADDPNLLDRKVQKLLTE